MIFYFIITANITAAVLNSSYDDGLLQFTERFNTCNGTADLLEADRLFFAV